ncbi:22567_t:CDS:1, partial [Gigaspora margarita]
SNLTDENITQITKSALLNPNYSLCLPQFICITSEISQPPPLSPLHYLF